MKKMMLIGIILALGCSSGPAPKDTVFEFIDAVKLDDSTRVVQILDLDSYIESMMMEMTPAESTQVIAENRLKIMQSLLGDGDVRQKWMHSLIVVNEEVVQDSLAEVEVLVHRPGGRAPALYQDAASPPTRQELAHNLLPLRPWPRSWRYS